MKQAVEQYGPRRAVVGEIGLELRFGVAVNLTPIVGAAAKVQVEKPDGTVVTWSGAIVNAGQGTFKYVTVANDLDQAGVWTLRPFVEGTGAKHYGPALSMAVEEVAPA